VEKTINIKKGGIPGVKVKNEGSVKREFHLQIRGSGEEEGEGVREIRKILQNGKELLQ